MFLDLYKKIKHILEYKFIAVIIIANNVSLLHCLWLLFIYEYI